MGIAIQQVAVRRWAKINDHRLVATYADEGQSGSNGIEARVGLLDAINLITAGKAEGLVVPKLNRLARALTVQEATLAEVWSVGGHVFAVDTVEVLADDPGDPMRTALRQMIGVFAQLERGLIAARMRAGRQLKAERGGFAGGGLPLG